ncbi:MAG TPA: hypothetical protein DCS19_01315 [Flavobacterium sp.]|nr:hypothetical protein [Flavobacterium sp.]
MNLTDGSYFINDITIPNITGNGGAYTVDIINAITKYENEVRIDLLGYELNKLLEADLNNSGVPQTQRFIDLINGAEFTYPDTGQLLKWIGFKNTQKESLISYYVYYNYVYYKNDHLSGVGTVKVDAEHSKRVSPFDKLENAWKRFQKLYAGFSFDECENFTEDGMKVDDLPGTFNGLASAYNFLYANKEDYPEWVFTVKYDKNIFSL